MNGSKATGAEKVQAWHLVIPATAVLLVVGGVFGGLFSLPRRAALSNMSPEAQNEARSKALEPTKTQVEQRVAHLRKLRGKWRPWALRHQKELRRMLHSRPAAQSAFSAVYTLLPVNPTLGEAGFTSKDLNLVVPGSEGFTWQPGAKAVDFSKIKQPSGGWVSGEDARQMLTSLLQENFATRQDIQLSRSTNTGFSRTVLWVSGRITEEKEIDNPNPGPGRSAKVNAPPLEIEPPYDFLKQ